MLDVAPVTWLRPRQEKFEEQRKSVQAFAKMWKDYDWTEQLAMAEEYN